MFRRLVSVGVAVGFFATAAVSWSEPPRPVVKAKAKAGRCRPPATCKELHEPSYALRRAPQKITFGEGDLVRGNRATGGGTLVDGYKRTNFSHLILVRQTFVPELIKSADKVW